MESKRVCCGKGVSESRNGQIQSRTQANNAVSKDDLKEILAQEKAAKADKPRRGPKPRGTLITEQIPEQTLETRASKV
jgi:hypothetical protein